MIKKTLPIITFMPKDNNFFAVSQPMPLVPPVIRAVRPSHRKNTKTRIRFNKKHKITLEMSYKICFYLFNKKVEQLTDSK